MAQHKRFKYRSLVELKAEIEDLNIELPLDEDLSVLSVPQKIGSHTSPNRLVIQPMEGRDADRQGCPTSLTFRRYERYAEGGAGLIWFEAVAVSPQARSSYQQMIITQENKDSLKELLTKTRQKTKQIPLYILQLQDAGRYRKTQGTKPAIISTNPYLDPPAGITDVTPLADTEVRELEDQMVKAAILAWQIGFDGVDLKACHRYLGSEFLAAYNRPGPYGGNFLGRTRFLFNVLEGIKAVVDKDFIITVRMNLYDGIPYPYGWGVSQEKVINPDPSEPIRLARLLAEQGVKMINTSNGCPYYNPHITRPYDQPLLGIEPPSEHPLEGVSRAFSLTDAVQKAHPDMVVVGSSYSYLRQYFPYAAAANIKNGSVKMVGLGRMAFAYPDFAQDLINSGKIDPRKVCITCSRCTFLMRTARSTGCVIRDREVYKYC